MKKKYSPFYRTYRQIYLHAACQIGPACGGQVTNQQPQTSQGQPATKHELYLQSILVRKIKIAICYSQRSFRVKNILDRCIIADIIISTMHKTDLNVYTQWVTVVAGYSRFNGDKRAKMDTEIILTIFAQTCRFLLHRQSHGVHINRLHWNHQRILNPSHQKNNETEGKKICAQRRNQTTGHHDDTR